jgi:hypothetical protein
MQYPKTFQVVCGAVLLLDQVPRLAAKSFVLQRRDLQEGTTVCASAVIGTTSVVF